MKKLIILFILTVFSTVNYAQKFAYVDSEYILSNIPAYKAAKDKLDQLSFEWQKEIEAQYIELSNMEKKFQNEKILLTDEMQERRKADLKLSERQIKVLQSQ